MTRVYLVTVRNFRSSRRRYSANYLFGSCR